MDVTVVVTSHREGLLLSPTLASGQEAIGHAREHGLTVETVLVLDRCDSLTRDIVCRHAGTTEMCRVLELDEGDPAYARNAGASAAEGRYISYLDGDDLWSFNWLTAAHEFCRSSAGPVIAHSEMNLIFGETRSIWMHVDSEDPDTDFSYQCLANLWDAMCFTRTDVMRTYPMRLNDLAGGYGLEDWDWNNRTLQAGIPHRPVKGTMHMKRRRRASQTMMCRAHDVVVRPSSLQRPVMTII